MPLQQSLTKCFNVGHTLPSLRATLRDADSGDRIDIDGETITFRMVSQADNSVKITGAAAVNEQTGPSNQGDVRYDWDAADVDTAGRYWAWFIRAPGGGDTEALPVGKKLIIEFADIP